MKPLDIVNRYINIKESKKNVMTEEIIQSFFDYIDEKTLQTMGSKQLLNVIEFLIDLPNEALHKHIIIESNTYIRNLNLKALTSSRYADKWNKFVKMI